MTRDCLCLIFAVGELIKIQAHVKETVEVSAIFFLLNAFATLLALNPSVLQWPRHFGGIRKRGHTCTQWARGERYITGEARLFYWRAILNNF